MPSKNKGSHAAVMTLSVITTLQMLVVTPFSYPVVLRNCLSYDNTREPNTGAVVLSSGHCDDVCEDFDNEIEVAPIISSPTIIPIYTSRRKFIRYSMTAITGATSFTTFTSGVGATDDYEYGTTHPPRASNDKNSMTIPTPVPPFSTTRTYRNIVLSNGLKVVLVQDSMVQRSSVAMSIDGAGQFAEPESIPGLAHLMEHIILSSTRSRGKNIIERETRMLRNMWDTDTGTVNSAGEEDFEDWLSENDGESNAFTAPGFVCFHFNSPHEVRFVAYLQSTSQYCHVLKQSLPQHNTTDSTGGVRKICQTIHNQRG